MTRRRTGGREITRGGPRTTVLTQMARSHEQMRNRQIVRVLLYLEMLIADGTLTGEVRLRRRKAKWQSFRSRAGNQAAHVVPCGLEVGTPGGWIELTSICKPGPSQDSLRLTFGFVEDLAAVINKTDTLAEDFDSHQGLCEALESACRALATFPRRREPQARIAGLSRPDELMAVNSEKLHQVAPIRRAGLDASRVRAAFSLYSKGARLAFLRASLRILRQAEASTGKIAPREAAHNLRATTTSSPDEFRRQQLLIVEAFQEAHSWPGCTQIMSRSVEKNLVSRTRLSHSRARFASKTFGYAETMPNQFAY